MIRVSSWLFRATVVAGVVALAACDAPSVSAPVQPSKAPRVGIPGLTQPSTMTADDDTFTCRSGYHIAYRDGVPYCEADDTIIP